MRAITPDLWSACSFAIERQLAVHPPGLRQARVHYITQRVHCRQQVFRRPHDDAAVVLRRRQPAEAVARVVIVHWLARFVPQSALDLRDVSVTLSKQQVTQQWPSPTAFASVGPVAAVKHTGTALCMPRADIGTLYTKLTS